MVLSSSIDLLLVLICFNLLIHGSKSQKSYFIWTAETIQARLEQWKEIYPNFLEVSTAQEKYNLPAAGTASDCPFYNQSIGCPNYIFTIQDFVTHPPDSESSACLPELFWSGSLHGNERVGPTAIMETAWLLLEAASCEALSNRIYQGIVCRKTLRQNGISNSHRKWLARLVSTRRIIVVPTGNALGYYQNRRTEENIDPNRDFPYDLFNPSQCMQSIAARTMNEVFREHMFQLALTFHAGTELIGYEWGSPFWISFGSISPDDQAQVQIASAYSRYGGGWSTSKPYVYGTMHDLLYSVRGGMEDWAYAASWDTDRVLGCEPTTYGGYANEKTVYNNSTLRVVNMLVETSIAKEPRRDLGTSLNVLDSSSLGNGHVPRNIRLALLSAELVEPYVSIFKVNNVTLTEDIVPLKDPQDSCATETIVFKGTSDKIKLEVVFTVGGALNIDNVQLWFRKESAIESCLIHPTSLDGFEQGTIAGSTTGTGQFSNQGSSPRIAVGHDELKATNGPIFRGSITLPNALEDQEIVILASARVDQDWKEVPQNAAPFNFAPQSHIVNARTNPEWKHDSGGKQIRGRLDWFSRPLKVLVSSSRPSESPTTTQSLDPSDASPAQNSPIIPSMEPTEFPTIEESTLPPTTSAAPGYSSFAIATTTMLILNILPVL